MNASDFARIRKFVVVDRKMPSKQLIHHIEFQTVRQHQEYDIKTNLLQAAKKIIIFIWEKNGRKSVREKKAFNCN